MYRFLVLGPIHLNMYYTFMALALFIPIWQAPKRAERMLPGTEREINNMVLTMFFGALVGFRFFHVFFELPGYYLSHPLQIFMVWKGGFVAYGGLFVPVVIAWIWIKARKLPPLITADILAAPITLVFVVARIGCFLNGCCWGKPTDSFLGVVFPPGGPAPAGVPLHPTQLYLSASALVTWLVIMLFEKTGLKRYRFPGLSAAIFLVLYPLARFLVEFVRADFRGGTFAGMSVSQTLSLLLMALGVVIFLKGLGRDKDGLESGRDGDAEPVDRP